MSSLDQDDADKRLQRAVPWVSDPQHVEQRDNETRRLQEDVIEAAKRLERESAKSQPPAEAGNAVGFRLSEPRMRKDKLGADERAEEIWAQLKPKFISTPTRDGWGLHSLTIAAGFLPAAFSDQRISAVDRFAIANDSDQQRRLQPMVSGQAKSHSTSPDRDRRRDWKIAAGPECARNPLCGNRNNLSGDQG